MNLNCKDCQKHFLEIESKKMSLSLYEEMYNHLFCCNECYEKYCEFITEKENKLKKNNDVKAFFLL